MRLLIRAEGPGAIGDCTVEINPGETTFGKTFEDWSNTPSGPLDVGDTPMILPAIARRGNHRLGG